MPRALLVDWPFIEIVFPLLNRYEAEQIKRNSSPMLELIYVRRYQYETFS